MGKISSYYIFYIVGFGIFPILGMILFVYADGISKEYEGQLRGFVLLPVYSFLVLIMTLPRKPNEYQRIGYEQSKRAHFYLDVIRRGWLSVFILTLIIFGLQIAFVAIIAKSYFEVFPGPAWIPVLSIMSVLWYLLTNIVFGYWDKNEHFRLHMAKGTCESISKKEDKFEKVKTLIQSLRWYERYASIALNLKLRNFEYIISRILTQQANQQTETIRIFSQAFRSSDPLEPLRELSKVGDLTSGGESQGKESPLSRLKSLELILGLIASALAILAYFGNLLGRPAP